MLSKVINVSICKHTFSIRTVRSHLLFSYSLLGLAKGNHSKERPQETRVLVVEKILDCFCCDIVSVSVSLYASCL